MTEELTTTLKILPRLIYESPKHFHENVQRRPPIRGANIINQIYDGKATGAVHANGLLRKTR